MRECLKSFVDTIRVSDDDLVEIVSSVDGKYIKERFEYSDWNLLTNFYSRFDGIAFTPKNFHDCVSNNLFTATNKPQFADDFKKINNKTDKYSALEVRSKIFCALEPLKLPTVLLVEKLVYAEIS